MFDYLDIDQNLRLKINGQKKVRDELTDSKALIFAGIFSMFLQIYDFHLFEESQLSNCLQTG